MHLFKYPQRFGGMQAPCVGFHSGRPNGMGMYQHHIIGQTLFPRAHQRCEGKTVAAEVGENFHHLDFVDRKSTRLNSSHVAISYAVFCLKKKKHMSTSRRSP